jgi:hypothetical protein
MNQCRAKKCDAHIASSLEVTAASTEAAAKVPKRPQRQPDVVERRRQRTTETESQGRGLTSDGLVTETSTGFALVASVAIIRCLGCRDRWESRLVGRTNPKSRCRWRYARGCYRAVAVTVGIRGRRKRTLFLCRQTDSQSLCVSVRMRGCELTMLLTVRFQDVQRITPRQSVSQSVASFLRRSVRKEDCQIAIAGGGCDLRDNDKRSSSLLQGRENKGVE